MRRASMNLVRTSAAARGIALATTAALPAGPSSDQANSSHLVTGRSRLPEVSWTGPPSWVSARSLSPTDAATVAQGVAYWHGDQAVDA